MLPALLLLAALQQTPPAEAPVCPATPVSLTAPWSGWTTAAPLAAASKAADLGAATLTLGHRADISLMPASGVTFGIPLARPIATDSTGGLVAITIATPGTYRLALGSALWADMIGPDGKPVSSIAHGHGPDCSGIHKYVDFPLQPGRYVLQLSGGKVPAVGAMLTPLP